MTEPKHCVFLTSDFLKHHPNLESWIRNSTVLDCISVDNTWPFVAVEAVHQKFPKIVNNLNLWVPQQYVTAVVLNASEKTEIGFHQCNKKKADFQ